MDETSPRARRAFLTILAAALVTTTLILAWPYLTPIVLATVTAFILYPLHARLTRNLLKDWLSAALMLLLTTVALVGPLVAIAWSLRQEAQRALGALQEHGARDLLRQALSNAGLPEAAVDRAVSTTLSAAQGFVASQTSQLASLTLHIFVAIIVFYVLLFFFLRDGPRLVRFLKRVTPLGHGGHVDLMRATGGRVKALVLGTLIIAIIQGTVAAVGWWLLGLPNPLFWGVVMMVLEIIPLAGAFLVLLPAAAWQAATGAYFTAIGLVVLSGVAVGLVDDVVRPYIIGRLHEQMHPAVVLVGIVGGLVVIGPAGLILGPVLVSLLGPVLEAWSGRDAAGADRIP